MKPNGQQNARLDLHAPRQKQPMFHRVLTADPNAVRATLTALRVRFRDDVTPDALGRLELVLAEVMNNVAEHAISARATNDPKIHLCVVRHETGLACAITDDGESLPDDCLLPRQLPQVDPADLPEGGFGWYLIQDLTQELRYYREGQRNYLAFSIPDHSPQAENGWDCSLA